MKRLAILVLLLALAGCNLSNTAIPDADWCYRWDFTQGAQDFSVSAGNWVAGRGFVTDDNGYLNVHRHFDVPVTPTGVIVLVGRAESTVIPIHVSATIVIFGTRFGSASTDVDAGTERAYLTHPMYGSSGYDIAIDGRASGALQLQSIEVRGDNPNPFGSSNCSGSSTDFDPILVPADDILGGLQQADQQLLDVNAPLTAPNGSPLLPDTSAIRQIFGYAKWLIAPSTADSLAGPFAPIISGLGILLTLEVVLLGVYGTVYVAVYFFRWLVWIFKLILAIVQAVASAANGVVGFLLSFIGL